MKKKADFSEALLKTGKKRYFELKSTSSKLKRKVSALKKLIRFYSSTSGDLAICRSKISLMVPLSLSL